MIRIKINWDFKFVDQKSYFLGHFFIFPKIPKNLWTYLITITLKS